MIASRERKKKNNFSKVTRMWVENAIGTLIGDAEMFNLSRKKKIFCL
jgi:hypothetical protein